MIATELDDVVADRLRAAGQRCTRGGRALSVSFRSAATSAGFELPHHRLDLVGLCARCS